MKKFNYVGCFFEQAALDQLQKCCDRHPLERAIATPHVTLCYRPKTAPAEAFGLPVEMQVVGYGNDGKNEALLVAFTSVPPCLQSLAAEVQTPHITLSVTAGARPVNSRHLTFSPITPFVVTGIFGGHTGKQTVVTAPPATPS